MILPERREGQWERTPAPMTTPKRGRAGVDPQRRLAASPFPTDTGAASAETRRLIAAAATEATPAAYLRAVAALCGDRLLVPVVATTTRLGETVAGLPSDKEAEMSLVILQVRDGRRALLAFTGLDALQSWQSDARPVPVTIDIAAQAGSTTVRTRRRGAGRTCSRPPPY